MWSRTQIPYTAQKCSMLSALTDQIDHKGIQNIEYLVFCRAHFCVCDQHSLQEAHSDIILGVTKS